MIIIILKKMQNKMVSRYLLWVFIHIINFYALNVLHKLYLLSDVAGVQKASSRGYIYQIAERGDRKDIEALDGNFRWDAFDFFRIKGPPCIPLR